METEGYQLRIEVCEKCYEHQSLDPHSQTIFQQASAQVKSICEQLKFSMIKNHAYRYLRKLKDSKISSKRYLDTNTNKIIQFPRKSAFEIYYFNVLIFSRLKLREFPNYTLLKNILIAFKQIKKRDPLLKGFQLFRDIEIQYKFSPQKVECIYQYATKYCSEEDNQTKVKQALKKIIQYTYNRQKINKINILPYSRFISQQKHYRMQNIYCPISKIKSTKNNKSIESKVGSYIRLQKKTENMKNNKELISERNKKIFDKIKSDEIKSRHKNTIISERQNHRLQKLQSQVKQIYVSYMNILKQKNHRPIKTAKSATKLHNREYSAITNRKNLKRINSSSPKVQPKITKQNKTVKQHSKDINYNESGDDTIILKNRQSQQSNQTLGLLTKKSDYDPFKFSKKQSNSPVGNDGEQIQLSSFDKIKIQAQILQNTECKMNKKQSSVNCSRNDKKIEQYFIRKDKLLKHWNKYRSQFNQRQTALITSKFSQIHNFSMNQINQVFQDKDKQIIKHNVKFLISGDQLTKKIRTISLQQIFQPHEICLFPSKITIVQKQSEYSSNNFIAVINCLIERDPLIIIRIFQNKKLINPNGIYCVWLKNNKGTIQPIFVDDSFAVFIKESQNKIQQYRQEDLVYCRPYKNGQIWLMVLEKAIAKILGGYNNLNNCSISQLFNIIMGFPTVDFSHLTVERATKVFDQNILINRKAKFYAKKLNKEKTNNDYKIVQILEYQKNQGNPKQSKLLVLQQTKKYINLNEFIRYYAESTLSFYRPDFYFNQFKLKASQQTKIKSCIKSKSQQISLRIKSLSSKNNCFFMLSFGDLLMKNPFKVILYRNHEQQQENLNSAYSYVGQIEKIGDFFFENQLQGGQYVCILEGTYWECQSSDRPYLSIISQKPVAIAENNCEYQVSKNSKLKRIKKTMNQTPLIIIEKNICNIQNSLLNQNTKSTKQKKPQTSKFKIRKQFIQDTQLHSQKQI